MVVDNVDDRTMFFEQRDDMTTDKCLVEYVPQAAKGSIIYTTRSRDIGIDLASGDEPVKVSPMNIDDGLLMLGDKVTRGSTKEEQETLLEELAYLPLAISQATAYMVKRRRSIADYIKLLRDESTRTRVLDHRTLHHGRQDRSSESVTRTWWITFQWLKKENPRSAELLTMMSLLDRQQIPLALVQDTDEDILDFEEAIGVLDAFSLVHLYSYVQVCDKKVVDALSDYRKDLLKTSSQFCDMHRLVQASTREWLSRPENDRVYVATKTLVSVSTVFPSVFHEAFFLCRMLYPHADAVLAYNSSELNFPLGRDEQISSWNFEHRAYLLLYLSKYLRHQEDFALSEDRASQSLEIHRRLFGSDECWQTLDSMESLALTIASLGRRAESLETQRKILEGRERLLGPNHHSTLRSLSQIGYHLRSQGEYPEAEMHHRRGLAATRMLHEVYPDDLDRTDALVIALTDVANLRLDQGEFEEAQTLLLEALELSRDIFGPGHHSAWETMETLAITFGQLAKYEEAHALLDEVLSGRRKGCGETHCATLTTRSRYALLLAREGKYALAEEEFWSMLGDETLVNGVRKRVVMNNLGLVLKLQKKYGEAEHIFKHLLKLQEQASDTMPSVQAHHRPPGSNAANSRASIATCLEAQGKTDEAEKYLSNPPLPSTTEDDVEEAKTLHERSLDMLDGGQYNEAEATARKELVIRMEHAGLDDNRTQTCLLQIARALHGQNPHCDSQSLTRQVLAYRKRVFGCKNIETQAALKFLAITTLDQGKLEEAEACYRQLVRWLEYTHSKLYVETVYAREALAEVLGRQRKYPEAEELCRLNLEVELHTPIRSEPRLIARAYYNLGYALWDQSHNAEAETYFHHAYDRYVELFGRSDADTTNSLVCLAEVVAEQGKSHEAEELYLLLGESVALQQSEDEDSDEEDSDEEDSVGEDSTKETRTKIRD